jgi:sterol desaturase/sphingolipid hydroxylase (fatty acid hydroxylase superfamily)
MGVKAVIIIALGAPPIAVLLFEIILNGMAMFNHSNIKLLKGADRILRLLLVTPDFHRVHHSVNNEEMNSNFGFNISIWDRMFGSYRQQPHLGHEKMEIGLAKGLSPTLTNRLSGMLMLPFRKIKPSSTL